ncbi:OLC1v1000958C1 [Oldenlandia corymbosa var. corymbosa]|uniref:OLC1v1000958C1 n=1 Tax=Oldenlandia corymbosa var. corymbosa TaxID=529605 RepID=A0AAV1D706_OLDCO|nr:OLC1v1000958C1 [Oldenlandia corymbosa var. corymbosa]
MVAKSPRNAAIVPQSSPAKQVAERSNVVPNSTSLIPTKLLKIPRNTNDVHHSSPAKKVAEESNAIPKSISLNPTRQLQEARRTGPERVICNQIQGRENLRLSKPSRDKVQGQTDDKQPATR